MVGMIGRRIGIGLITLWVVSLVIFAGTEILPGDVAEIILGQSATPENLAALRAELGLDKPAPIRYVDWLRGIATGDLGGYPKPAALPSSASSKTDCTTHCSWPALLR